MGAQGSKPSSGPVGAYTTTSSGQARQGVANPQQLTGAAALFGPDDPEEMPLANWFILAAWRSTRGSARIDLKRPTLPDPEPGRGLLGARDPGAYGYGRGDARRAYNDRYSPHQAFATAPQRGVRGYAEDAAPVQSSWPGLLGFGTRTGARLKVMRHIEFGKGGSWRRNPPTRPAGTAPPLGAHAQPRAATGLPHSSREQWQAATAQSTNPPGTIQKQGEPFRTLQGQFDKVLHQQPVKPLFDLGVGLNFDMDSTNLSPLVRLKVQDWLSIQAVPRPLLKLQKRWQLPATRLSMRLVYDCPLEELDHFWLPPARVMLRIDNLAGTGIHVGPSGIEFDERLVTRAAGRETALRCAASVNFPRKVPVEEGQPLLDWQIERLGLKTRW
ncbi:hypothetical protein WJX72_012533 [[Myrmecia] bisecta]|uniref:Uncharacterized protein n=1 Tax=[Myrmecia] bisecta TaxID=41462 RepID=A0AAW1QGU0_9CHLO